MDVLSVIQKFDQQAIGWIDDGSESGVQRTRATRGDFAKVPFHAGNYFQSDGSNASYNPTSFPDNADGSNSSIQISVAFNSGGNGSRIIQPFRGSCFGIRFRQDVNVVPFFTVTVDGVAYPVSARLGYIEQNSGTTVLNGEASILIVDGLDPGIQHYAEIVVVMPATGTNVLDLYGMLLDRQQGYDNKKNYGIQAGSTVVNLSTSPVSFPSSNSFVGVRGVQTAIFTNTRAGIVTVGVGGAAVAATSVPVVALPGPLPAGAVVIFQTSTGQVNACLTAAAAAADTSITVTALSAALVAGAISQSVIAPITVTITDSNAHVLSLIPVQAGDIRIVDFGLPNTASAASPYFYFASSSTGMNSMFVGMP